MNICITGAVLNGKSGSIKRYQIMKDLLVDYCDEIYTPIETMKFLGSSKERYLRAVKSIKESDMIIADVSIPSTGQGMELMLAKQYDKKVFCIAKQNSKVSGLIIGAFKDVFYYNTTKDVINFITENIIKNIQL